MIHKRKYPRKVAVSETTASGAAGAYQKPLLDKGKKKKKVALALAEDVDPMMPGGEDPKKGSSIYAPKQDNASERSRYGGSAKSYRKSFKGETPMKKRVTESSRIKDLLRLPVPDDMLMEQDAVPTAGPVSDEEKKKQAQQPAQKPAEQPVQKAPEAKKAPEEAPKATASCPIGAEGKGVNPLGHLGTSMTPEQVLQCIRDMPAETFQSIMQNDPNDKTAISQDKVAVKIGTLSAEEVAKCRPSQNAIFMDKSFKFIVNDKKTQDDVFVNKVFDGGKKMYVAEDLTILDGHHRWMEAVMGPECQISNVVIISLPGPKAVAALMAAIKTVTANPSGAGGSGEMSVFKVPLDPVALKEKYIKPFISVSAVDAESFKRAKAGETGLTDAEKKSLVKSGEDLNVAYKEWLGKMAKYTGQGNESGIMNHFLSRIKLVQDKCPGGECQVGGQKAPPRDVMPQTDDLGNADTAAKVMGSGMVDVNPAYKVGPKTEGRAPMFVKYYLGSDAKNIYGYDPIRSRVYMVETASWPEWIHYDDTEIGAVERFMLPYATFRWDSLPWRETTLSPKQFNDKKLVRELRESFSNHEFPDPDYVHPAWNRYGLNLMEVMREAESIATFGGYKKELDQAIAEEKDKSEDSGEVMNAVMKSIYSDKPYILKHASKDDIKNYVAAKIGVGSAKGAFKTSFGGGSEERELLASKTPRKRAVKEAVGSESLSAGSSVTANDPDSYFPDGTPLPIGSKGTVVKSSGKTTTVQFKDPRIGKRDVPTKILRNESSLKEKCGAKSGPESASAKMKRCERSVGARGDVDDPGAVCAASIIHKDAKQPVSLEEAKKLIEAGAADTITKTLAALAKNPTFQKKAISLAMNAKKVKNWKDPGQIASYVVDSLFGDVSGKKEDTLEDFIQSLVFKKKAEPVEKAPAAPEKKTASMSYSQPSTTTPVSYQYTKESKDIDESLRGTVADKMRQASDKYDKTVGKYVTPIVNKAIGAVPVVGKGMSVGLTLGDKGVEKLRGVKTKSKLGSFAKGVLAKNLNPVSGTSDFTRGIADMIDDKEVKEYEERTGHSIWEALNPNTGEQLPESNPWDLSNPKTAEAVMQMLKAEGLEEDEVEVSEGYWGWPESRQFATVEVGNRDYGVAQDYDAAVRFAEALVLDQIQSEPELFTPSWLEYYINEERLRGDLYTDVVEMELESLRDVHSDEKLDMMGKDEEEYTDEEGDVDYDAIDRDFEETIDDVAARRADEALRDPIGYLIDIYGEEEGRKQAMNIAGIDANRAAEDAVSSDGPGHFLASYDGELRELPGGGVYWRHN